MLKVLFIVTYATDYREPFFRELGKMVELTIIAQPCDQKNLSPPNQRKNYRYIEIPIKKLFGFFWQPNLSSILKTDSWDIVCSSFSLRQPDRLMLFINNKSYWGKWVWWGHLIGKNNLKITNQIKKFFLNKSAACLTYSDYFSNIIKKKLNVDAISFNNTQILLKEFRNGKFENHSGLRFLFVGRNQERKKLDRLVWIAEKWPNITIRIIGPGMETLDIPKKLVESNRISILGRITGDNLNEHFDWADIIVNPGHVGLLVTNAAKHGKGIVIDKNSPHAPEFYLASKSNQPFISFVNEDEVSNFINKLENDKDYKIKLAHELQDVALKEYTVENMVCKHLKVFDYIAPATFSSELASSKGEKKSK